MIWLDVKIEPLDADMCPLHAPIDAKQGKDSDGSMRLQATFRATARMRTPSYSRLIVQGEVFGVYKLPGEPVTMAAGDDYTLNQPLEIRAGNS